MNETVLMRVMESPISSAIFAAVVSGCANQLPEDIMDYRERCVLMNPVPIPVAGDDDPHLGNKNVYACNVSEQAQRMNTRPFESGTIIVKESTRDDSDFPWLIATARKTTAGWSWNEYSRNFASEEFLEILASESVCIDCHKKVEGVDWIYTFFAASPE